MAKLDEADRDHLGERQFAFPKERKEPLEDATHVRNAVARFDQVKGVSDAQEVRRGSEGEELARTRQAIELKPS